MSLARSRWPWPRCPAELSRVAPRGECCGDFRHISTALDLRRRCSRSFQSDVPAAGHLARHVRQSVAPLALPGEGASVDVDARPTGRTSDKNHNPRSRPLVVRSHSLTRLFRSGSAAPRVAAWAEAIRRAVDSSGRMSTRPTTEGSKPKVAIASLVARRVLTSSMRSVSSIEPHSLLTSPTSTARAMGLAANRRASHVRRTRKR